MARFNETVNIQTQDLRTGAVERSLSLVDRLEGFRVQQLGVAQQEAVQRGVESGQQKELEKVDVDGQQVTVAPEKKKKRFIGSIEVQAHNKTLQAAYLASLDSDNRNAITRIAGEHSSDITAFNSAIESYNKGVLKNVDPAARNIVAQSLEDRTVSAQVEIQSATVKRQNEEAQAVLAENVESASNEAARQFRNGDQLQGAEELVKALDSVDATDWAVDKKSKVKREIRREAEEGHLKHGLDQTLENKGIDAAFSELSKLEEKVPKGWTPDEWESFISGEQSGLNKELTKRQKAIKVNNDELKKQSAFNEITDRIDGDDSIIVDAKVADDYYSEFVEPSFQGMTIDEKQARQSLFVDRLKMIPKTIKNQITNAANSDNIELIKEAAGLIDRLDNVRGVVEQVPASERSYIENVTALMQNRTPQEAVLLARAATDPKDKARIEQVDFELKQEQSAKNYGRKTYLNRVQNIFDGGFFGGTTVDDVAGDQLAAEYKVEYENLRRAGTSESAAHEKTEKIIERNWSESNATGKTRVMRHAPETFYQIDGDIEWLQKELLKEVNADTAGGGVKLESIVLMSNDVTSRTATTGRPSYAVKVLTNGTFQYYGQWRPDYEKELNRVRGLNVEDAAKRRAELMNKKPLAVESLQGGF